MSNKVRPTDLTVKELPHSRKEVFIDLLKHQKRQLVSLSMLTFVFLLPLAVNIILFNQFIVGANLSIDDAAVRASTMFSLILYMMLICIPLVMVGFIGLGGLAYVCKNIVWQEGIISGPDFFKGIKKNWVHAMFSGLIWGVSLFIFVVGVLFFARVRESSETPIVFSFGIGLCVVQFIIFSIVCTYSLTYTCYYQNTFREVMKNSFIFFAAKFLKNIILFILSTGLMVGLMFIDFIAQIVVIIFLAFFISFYMVAWTLLSHEAFDQYINKANYPDYYKKGLYIIDSSKEE